eukprot:1150252-Pelagomonas_calceolata.AAC.3
MLDENVSPAADQPDSRAVGQPLVTRMAGSSNWKARGLTTYFCPASNHRLYPFLGKLSHYN